MKKRILSILLTLCMVLMLCPMTAFADEGYYTITQNFKYGTRTYPGDDPHTSPYTFEIPANGTCTLGTIEDCSPYELVGWQESGMETVYPPYAEIEVNSARTFDAVYQVQGGLTITVDGFMPGKTLADCTLSIDSTIPGVTFSKDDVQSVMWLKYRFDGHDYLWYAISETEEIEADTQYKCQINLNNKKLELAPAVTVNGNTPKSCKIATSNGVPIQLQIVCELGTPVAPTLAVTVDNFEVGKTPKDITYSFASTNLGVTFSEEDILYKNDCWHYFDEEEGSWAAMSDTAVFEAGTRYRCSIQLDNKGLDTAPTVTVNGKTPEYCGIATSNGVPYALEIGCDLGAPLAQQLTISGQDVVCKEQDYEFSVTAAEGAEALYSVYRLGEYGSEMPWSRVENGVWYGTVPASEYGDADSIELTVYGKTASGKPATATKTVQISKEHRFVDGVCGCGAKQQYTITVPFTITVKLGGSVAPGKTTFNLQVINSQGDKLSYDDVEVKAASVTTNGAGSYSGKMTITGPSDTLLKMLDNKVFVKQAGIDDPNWTVDDAVWGLVLEEVAALSSADDVALEYPVLIFPAECKENENGKYYEMIDGATDVGKMSFTNTYTKSATAPSDPEGTTSGNSNNDNVSKTDANDSVKTGDATNLALWIALMLLSVAGITGVTLYTRRKRTNK